MPRSLRPRAALSSTLIHGSKRVFLEHDAALGARPRDGRAVHDDAARGGPQEPGDGRDSSVDLPQPEGPSTHRNSLSRDARSRPSTARWPAPVSGLT